MLAAQRKNLEGISPKPLNSFVVLNNVELVSRSRNMGVNIGEIEMEKIDLLRDLELARANLVEKPNGEGHEEC
jgi:hypothetical protein